MRYEVFTAGEELFHAGDELLTVATAFDLVYVYVRNNILCDIHERDPPCAYVHMYFVRIDPRFRASR